MGGTVYKIDCMVVLRVEDDFPQFAYVEDILVGNDSLVHFIVNDCNTHFFSNHFHTYVFVHTSVFSFVSQGTLQDPARKVSGLTRAGQRAVVMKHHYSSLRYVHLCVIISASIINLAPSN